MQTKKNFPGRSAAREDASPRGCTPQKKVSDSVQLADKKVTELITSSARKHRFAGILPERSKEPIAAKNTNISYFLAHDETSDIYLEHGTVEGDTFDHKGLNEGVDERVLGTIFSPAFHISKDVGGDIANGVDFLKLFKREDHEAHTDRGMEESQVDLLKGHANLESYSVGKEERKSHENMGMAVDTEFPGEMDVDSSMSSENSDVRKSGYMSLSEINAVDSHCNADLVGTKLSTEVSATYFAMQQSKLECVDEPGEDSMSAEVCADADDCEEFGDFDPYLFIKSLPDLSSVVPTFRPMLLPKQTRSCPSTTLVLDLDETLVHSTLERCDNADFTFPVNFNLKDHTVYVRCRPHLKDFMERIASLFEIIIFTASQSIYAERLLNVLDPKRRIFRHRVYRESCVFVDGNYLKDLSVLGRDLSHVFIIDNSPQAFGFQVDNGIPIESWFDDRTDQELLLLLPFLESLVGVEDVRPLIAKKFNLRKRIEAAVHPLLNSNRGDPFER